jgi:hypothetical protein
MSVISKPVTELAAPCGPDLKRSQLLALQQSPSGQSAVRAKYASADGKRRDN